MQQEDNLLTKQSSESCIGIPLKKRKITYVQNPSPPRQACIPSKGINDSENELPKLMFKIESSNSSVQPQVLLETVINKASHIDDDSSQNEKLVVESEYPINLNPQKNSLLSTSNEGRGAGNKQRSTEDSKSIISIFPLNNEALVLSKMTPSSVNKEIISNNSTINDIKPLPGAPEKKSELITPELFGEQKKESKITVKQEKLNAFEGSSIVGCNQSRELNSIEGKVLAETKDHEPNVDASHMRETRCHWDLNIPMDTWEGSHWDTSLDEKPKCGDSAVFSDMHGKYLKNHRPKIEVQDSENKGNSSSKDKFLAELPDHHYESGLQLQLSSPSVFRSVVDKGIALQLIKQSLANDLNPNLSRETNLSVNNLLPVKSEPSDVDDIGVVNKSEGVDHNLVELKPLKSEFSDLSTNDGLEGTIKKNLESPSSGVISKPFENVSRGLNYGDRMLQSPQPTNVPTMDAITKNMSDSLDIAMPSPPRKTLMGLSEIGLECPQDGTETLQFSQALTSTSNMPITEATIKNMNNSLVDFEDLDKPTSSRKIPMEQVPAETSSCSYSSEEMVGSEDEKLNISEDILDEVCYDSDVGSDDSHVRTGCDDDYEDGELREHPKVHDSSVDPTKEEDKVSSDCGNTCSKETANNISISTSGERDSENEDAAGGENIQFTEVNALCQENSEQSNNLDLCLPETLTKKVPAGGSLKEKATKSRQCKSQNLVQGNTCQKNLDPDFTSNRSASMNQNLIDESQNQMPKYRENTEDCEGRDSTGAKNPINSKTETETPINSKAGTDDTTCRTTQNRIINLAQTSNGSLSERKRFIEGRPISLVKGRKQFVDRSLLKEKFRCQGDDGNLERFQRVRDQERLIDSFPKHKDPRSAKRLGTMPRDWDSGHDYSLEDYNVPSRYQFSGPKNAASLTAAKAKLSGFVVAPDGTIVSTGRSGRDPVCDDLRNFHDHPDRRSPKAREGQMSLDVKDARGSVRHTRDRGIPCDSSNMTMLRHGNEMVDPDFPCPRTRNRINMPFIRRERSFSSLPKRRPRFIPHPRSRSPLSPTRVSHTWSPTEVHSQFVGHSELSRHRSPPITRGERMRFTRSHPCFSDERIDRRHDSPPFISRSSDVRDVESQNERVHHSGSFISRRSPSGRILQRMPRHFNFIDPRDKSEEEEFFSGSPSGRFHEIAGEVCVDERRKITNRPRPVRRFRPIKLDEDDDFHYHLNDTRSYDDCHDDDTEFEYGRRRREFVQDFKYQAGRTPRNQRSIQESDDGYMPGQRWQDNFNNVSQLKRRRFE